MGVDPPPEIMPPVLSCQGILMAWAEGAKAAPTTAFPCGGGRERGVSRAGRAHCTDPAHCWLQPRRCCPRCCPVHRVSSLHAHWSTPPPGSIPRSPFPVLPQPMLHMPAATVEKHANARIAGPRAGRHEDMAQIDEWRSGAPPSLHLASKLLTGCNGCCPHGLTGNDAGEESAAVDGLGPHDDGGGAGGPGGLRSASQRVVTTTDRQNRARCCAHRSI